jgi:WD40 repeat protein
MRRFWIVGGLAALPLLVGGLLADEAGGLARYAEVNKSAQTKLVAVLGGPELEPTSIYGMPQAIAFSADGKRAVTIRGTGNPYFASANAVGAFLVYDVPSGALVRTWNVPSGWITALALTGDGKHALVGIIRANQQGQQVYELALLDPSAGKETRRLTGLNGPVMVLDLTPDGHKVIAAGQDGKIALWDLSAGKESRELGGHPNQVTALTVSPDGKLAVSAGQDGTLKVWDLIAGKEVRTLAGHKGVVNSIAFAADGKRMAAAGYGPDVKVWDVASGKELVRLTKPHQGNDLSSVALSADGTRLLVARLWQGGGTVVSSDLSLWDVDNRKELWISYPGFAALPRVLITPDGKRALGGGGANPFVLWDLADGKEVRAWGGHKGPVTAVAYSSNGKTLFSVSQDRTLKAWDVSTGRELRTFKGHTEAVTSVAVSMDSKQALTGSADMTLILWDVAGGKAVRTFKGHTASVTSVALSPDGKTALSGSGDRTLKLWDMATGNLLRTLTGHADGVTSVAVSPDGNWALSGSQDNTVKSWHLAPDDEQPVPWTVRKLDREVTRVAYLADGKHAIAASQDRTAILWNLAGAKAPKGYRGHSNWITDVAVSPDGKRVLTASDDLTVRLWDAQTAKELDRLDLGKSTDVPRSVAFAPDGRSFAVGTLSWTILRFELAAGKRK